MTGRWRRRLAWLVRRRDIEREMDDEMRYHLEMEAADHVARGLTPEEARHAAGRDFGSMPRFKEEGRAARGVAWADQTVQDAQFALRSFRRRPVFVVTVTLTLGVGIGAAMALFSVLDAVLLDPLAVRRPRELVAVYQAMSAKSPRGGVAYPTYRDYAAQSRTLASLAAFTVLDVGLQAGDRVEQTAAGVVSGTYFSTLGIRPHTGRLLGAGDETAPGENAVVVLGHALWHRAFRGDPSAVGRTVRIGGTPFTLVGVAPRGFRGTELTTAPELWVPVTMVRSLSLGAAYSAREVLTTRAFPWLDLVARLRPGVDRTAAAAELNAIARRVEAAEPPGSGPSDAEPANPISLVPVTEAAAPVDRGSLVRFVAMLFAVATLMLLVACVNVANLLLIRGGERARELGVRAALGAGRARLVRQLVVESALLAVAGATVGVGVAALAMHLLSAFVLPGRVAVGQLGLGIGPQVLAFALVLVVPTTLLFGLAPAVRASRLDVVGALRAPGGDGAGPMPRHTLVAAQVALSLAMLVGAALFLRSLRAALSTDLGFDGRAIAAVTIEPTLQGYTPARAIALYRQVTERLARTPGVTAAAAATHVPVSPSYFRLPLAPAERPERGGPDSWAYANIVSPGYFGLLGLRVARGRDFEAADDARSPRVAIVNESAARGYWPGRDPLGRQLKLFGQTLTVVGVVPDTKYHSVRDAGERYVYIPVAQRPGSHRMTILARGRSPEATLAAMRAAVAAEDPALPVMDPRRLADQLDRVLMPQRFGLTLLAVFGAAALLVSAVGVYGVVAYTVARRTRELGIRIALGAPRRAVLALVVRRTALAVAAGVVAGLAGAAAGTRALSAFLYGIESRDVPAFALAATTFALAALTAALLAARRAVRVDPVRAMRD